MHGLTRVSDTLRSGFKEDLWPLGSIDAIIKAASSGVFRLLHAGSAAAEIGDARGPDFLSANGSQYALWCRSWDLGELGGNLGQVSVQIIMSDQSVPIRVGKEEPGVLVQEKAVLGAVEMHDESARLAVRWSVSNLLLGKQWPKTKMPGYWMHPVRV